MRKNVKYRIISIASISLILLLWFLITQNQTRTEELLFPSLIKVYQNFINNFVTIVNYAIITWYRVLAGLILGIIIGFITGILITWNNYFEAIVDPIIELIRPIPPIALTPFFILWFGLGDLGQLLLIAIGCFMVIVVSTVNAIRNINPIYVRAAESLGADKKDIYNTILVPAVMPSLSSAIRVSAATGFGLTVAAEYLGAQGGLGFLIRNARVTLNTEAILLAAILLGIQSLFTDQIIRIVFRYITKWNHK